MPNPIGARVLLNTGGAGFRRGAHGDSGIVGDVRPSVTEDILPTVYVSEWQTMVYGGELVVRTAGDASAVIEPAKRALFALDPKLPLLFPRTLHDVLAALDRPAATRDGIDGNVRHPGVGAGHARRLQRHGVRGPRPAPASSAFARRSALGRKSILVLVLRQGVATTALGVVCGLGAAALVSRFVASLLAGVSAHDPLTFLAAPLLLVGVALVACMLPARAATRVQPVEALRVE